MVPTEGRKLVKMAVSPSAVQRETSVTQAKTVRNRFTPLKLKKKNRAKAITTTTREIRILGDIGLLLSFLFSLFQLKAEILIRF